MSAAVSYTLRRWTPADKDPFAAMNADPEVMRYFPAPLTREESDAFVERIMARFDEHGWGLWALDTQGEFAGFVGLSPIRFRDGVEIGWRLAQRFWGMGLATAAARDVLTYAWDTVGLDEILSFTATLNIPSQRVMQRIGMTLAEEFDHPSVPEGPLKRHVLYRISRPPES